MVYFFLYLLYVEYLLRMTVFPLIYIKEVFVTFI